LSTNPSAGERVELRFADTGPGIPEALRDRIFEPFFTYGKREGAGLELAIARRIVEEHGGELWAEGREGEGATFVVALPSQKRGERSNNFTSGCSALARAMVSSPVPA